MDLNVELHEIRGFDSPGEYERFVRWVNGMVLDRTCEEIIPSASHGLQPIDGDRRFLFRSGEIWRLAPPDFPFRGFWQRQDEDS